MHFLRKELRISHESKVAKVYGGFQPNEYAQLLIKKANTGSPNPKLSVIKSLLFLFLMLALTSCATVPPQNQGNLCAVFEQYPKWYDYSAKSQKKWGVPKQTLMAFVKQESSYKSRAKPPFKWFFVIPLGRGSSAKGYAQAQNPVWSEYQKERGTLLRGRTDMKDALDFIGWYNHRTNQRLGISKWNAKELYLAYHEGHGGYRSGTYNKKPQLLKVADKVARTSDSYGAQLQTCERRLRCRQWYKFWPFCS